MKDTQEKREVPHRYLCPISKRIMLDPVIIADEHNYDRSSITTWLFQYNSNISPMTLEVLKHKIIIGNGALKREIIKDCNTEYSAEEKRRKQESKEIENTRKISKSLIEKGVRVVIENGAMKNATPFTQKDLLTLPKYIWFKLYSIFEKDFKGVEKNMKRAFLENALTLKDLETWKESELDLLGLIIKHAYGVMKWRENNISLQEIRLLKHFDATLICKVLSLKECLADFQSLIDVKGAAISINKWMDLWSLESILPNNEKIFDKLLISEQNSDPSCRFSSFIIRIRERWFQYETKHPAGASQHAQELNQQFDQELSISELWSLYASLDSEERKNLFRSSRLPKIQACLTNKDLTPNELIEMLLFDQAYRKDCSNYLINDDEGEELGARLEEYKRKKKVVLTSDIGQVSLNETSKQNLMSDSMEDIFLKETKEEDSVVSPTHPLKRVNKDTAEILHPQTQTKADTSQQSTKNEEDTDFIHSNQSNNDIMVERRVSLDNDADEDRSSLSARSFAERNRIKDKKGLTKRRNIIISSLIGSVLIGGGMIYPCLVLNQVITARYSSSLSSTEIKTICGFSNAVILLVSFVVGASLGIWLNQHYKNNHHEDKDNTSEATLP